jgi:hypothetical protein
LAAILVLLNWINDATAKPAGLGACFVKHVRSDGDHLAFLRLFLGGIGNDDFAFMACMALSGSWREG